MIRLACSKAGQKVKTMTDNSDAACGSCSGIIIIDEISQYFEESVKGMFSLPRKPITSFNCPMTLADPRKSELVEKSE